MTQTCYATGSSVDFAGSPIVVDPGQQFTISGPVDLAGPIVGHVIVEGDPPGPGGYLNNVDLVPGATLDVRLLLGIAGTGSSPSLSGTGTFNVFTSFYADAPSPAYQGTINLLQEGTIHVQATGGLGNGPLNLAAGSTVAEGNGAGAVTLTNSQTTLSNGVDFALVKGQDLVFQHVVVVPAAITVKLGGGTLDFGDLRFSGKANLTISGSGIVRVKSRSQAKHIKVCARQPCEDPGLDSSEHRPDAGPAEGLQVRNPCPERGATLGRIDLRSRY